MPFPLHTLGARQLLRVESDAARATNINGYVWPAKKLPLTVAPKPVVPVNPPFSPVIDLPVRPGPMLTRLGKVTTPASGAPEFHLARRWAWVRYCWAFADRIGAASPLRLSAAAFGLTQHHRHALSEDLGIAVALEAAERYLLTGQPLGTRVEPVDVDEALLAGAVGGMSVAYAAGTRMRPDYLLVRTASGQPPQLFALECKGTHSGPVGLQTLHKAAAQVQGLEVGPAGVPAGGPGWGPPSGLIGGASFDNHRIRLQLYDPPGDRRWDVEPAARGRRSEAAPVVSVRADGSVQVDDIPRFNLLLRDVSEARLLTLAGREDAAAARLGQWPGDRPSARAATERQVRRDDDLGDFDGAVLRLPLEARDVVEVFFGVERDIADAIQADDDKAKEAALENWRTRRGDGDDAGDGALVSTSPADDSLTVALDDGILMRAGRASN